MGFVMPCKWPGHEDAMQEAGWCPECDEGDPTYFLEREGLLEKQEDA